MQRRLLAVALGVIALVSALSFRGFGPLDDDFIIFRYARNLIETGELSYNRGELVEGYVVPLWLFLMAGAMVLGVEPWLASRAIGIGAAALAVYLLARLWQRGHGDRLPVPALLVAVVPAFGYHANAGLGTTLLAFLLVAWALRWRTAVDRGEEGIAAGLLLGAAGLLRAEALLFALPFGVAELRRRRWRSIALACLPALLWLAFRVVYYREWLPNSYHVKRLGLAQDLSYGLEYLRVGTLELGVGVWLAFALVVLLRSTFDTYHRALAAGVLLHGLFIVCMGGDFMLFSRFFVPTVPLAVYLTWQALRGLSGERRRVYAIASALLFLAPQSAQGLRAGVHERYERYERRWSLVGHKLGSITGPEDRIATSPIGCIGYFSARPIVDMLGLTNDVLRHVEPDLDVTIKGHHRFDADWVLQEAPELIVPSNAQLQLDAPALLLGWEKDLLTDPRFVAAYRPILLPLNRSYPLIYYARNDVPVPPGAREVPRR